MRLVTYDRGGARRLGAWVDDVVVDLPDAVGHPVFPSTLESLVARNGGTTLDAARAALDYPGALDEFRVPRPHLLAPLAIAEGGHGLIGPGAPVRRPPGARGPLRCHPELACVVGRAGRNLGLAQAEAVIFGFTLVNGWSVPGPAGASTAIATAIGPCTVTADEFDPEASVLLVRIDGRPAAQAPLAGARRWFARVIADASAGAGVQPGEVYGWQPADPPPELPALRRGAEVEVEVPGIGVLANRVA